MQPQLLPDYQRYIDNWMKAFLLKTPVSPKQKRHESTIIRLVIMRR